MKKTTIILVAIVAIWAVRNPWFRVIIWGSSWEMGSFPDRYGEAKYVTIEEVGDWDKAKKLTGETKGIYSLTIYEIWDSSESEEITFFTQKGEWKGSTRKSHSFYIGDRECFDCWDITEQSATREEVEYNQAMMSSTLYEKPDRVRPMRATAEQLNQMARQQLRKYGWQIFF